MLVPRYWAEHRIQLREDRGPQTTIRRWGWSGTSQAEADQHARERAEAVATEVRAGKTLSQAQRRERKVAYNGADGLPIREEILQDIPQFDAAITRNQYGAHCLNVRDVLFADVDLAPTGQFDGDIATGWLVVTSGCLALGGAAKYPDEAMIFVVVFVVMTVALVLWRGIKRLRQRLRLRSPDWISHRVEAWCAEHPSWSLHLYRTPAGYRLLATHALFAPSSAEVTDFFRFFKVDPLFALMCVKQNCFRARLTGKPWRMNVAGKMGWGTWPPTTPAAVARRETWVAQYEQVATVFAACRHLSRHGSTTEHPRAAEIRRIHDEACRALSDLPLA